MRISEQFALYLYELIKDRGIEYKDISLIKKDGRPATDGYKTQLLKGDRTMTLDYANQFIGHLGLKVVLDGGIFLFATDDYVEKLRKIAEFNKFLEKQGYSEADRPKEISKTKKAKLPKKKTSKDKKNQRKRYNG